MMSSHSTKKHNGKTFHVPPSAQVEEIRSNHATICSCVHTQTVTTGAEHPNAPQPHCVTLCTGQDVKHSLLTGVTADWFDTTVPLKDFAPTFHPVILTQARIGWSNLLKGHSNVEWEKIHLKLAERTSTRINWTT